MVRTVLYVTLIIEIFFGSLSKSKSRESAHVLLREGSGKNLEMFLLRERSRLMNSNMVKSEQFDHLHLVYQFIVPLRLYS